MRTNNVMSEALKKSFNEIKIGIQDKNGLELFNGDVISIKIARGVTDTGVIVYEYGAFSLQVERGVKGVYKTTPLTSYASYCEITKIQ